MSVSFYMEHKKKLFSNRVLTVRELLQILPDLIQFGIDESAEEFDAKEFYETPLSKFECLLLGVDGRSARGFECSYGAHEGRPNYAVRVYTPCSIADWEIALDFISALSKQLGVAIVSEYGDTFTSESIQEFDYLHDIEFGIDSIVTNPEISDDSNSMIFGIWRPVSFNKRMREELKNAPDKARLFSEMITQIQYLDAFSANQRFYRMDDDSVMGVYVITQGVPTIVPYKPFVEFDHIELFDERTRKNILWKMHFVLMNEDEDLEHVRTVGPVDYERFIQRLPKEKYRFIDGEYILVEAMDEDEILQIVETELQ